jgi:hypothetical protein
MSVKQGDKPKVPTGIKIDPSVLEDGKAWAAMNHSNFSAMVEFLVKTVVDRDREALEKYKKLPKTNLGSSLDKILGVMRTQAKKKK